MARRELAFVDYERVSEVEHVVIGQFHRSTSDLRLSARLHSWPTTNAAR